MEDIIRAAFKADAEKLTPVRMIDAAFCAENGIDVISKQGRPSELEKLPEYRYYKSINDCAHRQVYSKLDTKQKTVLLNLINKESPDQKLSNLPNVGSFKEPKNKIDKRLGR